jgi:peptide deformylase
MKFKIIPNEQTPKIEMYQNPHRFIIEYKNMLEKFWTFTIKQKDCAGLAANQVSVNGSRIIDPFFMARDSQNRWDMIICPKILKYHGKAEEKIEGCLTWLGKKIIAERYPEIEVNYFNIKFEEFTTTIKGFQAQIWQHEYNHLMGIEEKFMEKEEK